MAWRNERKCIFKDVNYPSRKQNRSRKWVRLSDSKYFRREVSFAEGQAFARKNNIMFFETSAKTALNVEEAFLSNAKHILENIEKGEYDLSNEVGFLILIVFWVEYRYQTRECFAYVRIKWCKLKEKNWKLIVGTTIEEQWIIIFYMLLNLYSIII